MEGLFLPLHGGGMDFFWKSLLKQRVTQPELSPGSKAKPTQPMNSARLQIQASAAQ